MEKTYKSEAAMVIHDVAEGLYENGIIDKITMKEFDDTCLVPTPPLLPEEIRSIRANAGLSQPAFARYMNVSKNLVSDWERGVKKPGGAALRLLAIIKHKGISVVSV
ncbi:MAG: DNA-binding transcriptional regulator [Spirochaetaceae bacterium]|jgi:putative transcriptional regulator|nr:DNA-binding transcriptional regulator [Spirochaetaceae bacterium]